MPAISVSSRVVRAAVYARGAEVTRRVELTSQASEALELELPGVTAHALPSSLRAAATGAAVRGVRSRLVSAPAHDPEATRAALEAARAGLLALQAEGGWLRERRRLLESISPRAQLHEAEGEGEARPTRSPEGRLADALAVQRLRGSLLAEVDAELADLEARERAQTREVQRLTERRGAGPRTERTRVVSVELEPGGRLEHLELTYVVPTARWWPAYGVRLEQGGQAARWQLEAFVCQLSGEDWEGVELSLQTSDLISDASFPDLPAQRLGRRRAPARGFRAPPEGLDALFAGFDRDRARLQEVSAVGALSALPADTGAFRSITTSFAAASRDADASGSHFGAPLGGVQDVFPGGDPFGVVDEDDDVGAAFEEQEAAPPGAPAPDFKPAPARGGFAQRSRSAPMKKERAKRDGGGAPPPPPEPEWSGSEAWLDFDGLQLVGADAMGERGRLRSRRGRTPEVEAARQALDRHHPPGSPADPRAARGSFDHRFVAAAPVDVKSGLEDHRVGLQELRAPVTQRLRAVPVVEERVYREVELINPVDAPLLAGPVEVFFDDAFLTQTRIEAVPRGGVVRIGLGEEERVRVVRKVTSKEVSQGLLGGTTVVQHQVRFEVSSQLGVPVELELLARVPVPGEDQALEVTGVSTTPRAEAYPAARSEGGPKGGRRFVVALDPGGSATCELRYGLSFSAKSEVEGGNVRA